MYPKVFSVLFSIQLKYLLRASKSKTSTLNIDFNKIGNKLVKDMSINHLKNEKTLHNLKIFIIF